MYLRKYRLRKTWSDKCLKNRISEDPLTEDLENVSKHCCNVKDSIFTIFINHCEGATSKKVSFSETENPKTVC